MSEAPQERARIAPAEEISSLIHHSSRDVILALLENPAFKETSLCLLLERKDLPGEIL